MIVGIPAEIKDHEYRVAITPAGVRELTSAGHRVIVEHGAGEGSRIEDSAFKSAGAELTSTDEVWGDAEMILKVKEPVPSEFDRLRSGQILFTYLHLAASKDLTLSLMAAGITGVAYETVQTDEGALPLLAPMSEIAGRMAPQVGAAALQKGDGGKGILLGGVSGVAPGRVVVLGGGMAGANAAWIAQGMEAEVIVLDRDMDRLRYIDSIHKGRIVTLASNQLTVEEVVRSADLVIGAVLIPGALAPRLVTESMVEQMRPGTVIVDISIDQGGSVETSRMTTHSDPTYVVHDVVHYCVGNMPGAVPHTSTYALTNATLPYVMELANLGLRAAISRDPVLARGVNTISGKLVNRAVAEAHSILYDDIAQVLG